MPRNVPFVSRGLLPGRGGLLRGDAHPHPRLHPKPCPRGQSAQMVRRASLARICSIASTLWRAKDQSPYGRRRRGRSTHPTPWCQYNGVTDTLVLTKLQRSMSGLGATYFLLRSRNILALRRLETRAYDTAEHDHLARAEFVSSSSQTDSHGFQTAFPRL